jgi:hypothetical protein
MGARNRVVVGLSWLARLHRLTESIPRLLKSLNLPSLKLSEQRLTKQGQIVVFSVSETFVAKVPVFYKMYICVSRVVLIFDFTKYEFINLIITITGTRTG